MIIKSTRIPANHSKRIANYLSEPAENEVAKWIRGCPEDLLLMGEISKIAGKQYAVRHFVISPSEHMSQRDFTLVLAEICLEYGVSNNSGNRVSIVEHVKPRAAGLGNETHWHVAFPEHDGETGKTMSSRFYKIRNEKIARICELVLRHKIVPGRFNRQVYEAIQIERPQLGLAPFESALRSAAIQAGVTEDDWLKYRARKAASSHSRVSADI